MLLMALVDQGDYSSLVLALRQQLHAAKQHNAAELCSLLDCCCGLQMGFECAERTTAAEWLADWTFFSLAPCLPGPEISMLPGAAAAARAWQCQRAAAVSVLASMVEYCGYAGKASSKDACTSRWVVGHAVEVVVLGKWRTELQGGNIDSFSSASSNSTGTSSRPVAATGRTAQAVAWLALCGWCLLLLSGEVTHQLAITTELDAVGDRHGPAVSPDVSAKAGLKWQHLAAPGACAAVICGSGVGRHTCAGTESRAAQHQQQQMLHEVAAQCARKAVAAGRGMPE
jgi:hypothetical protein